MIKRVTSKDLMDIMDRSENTISGVKSDISAMKLDLEQKLTILSNIAGYGTERLSALNEQLAQDKDIASSTVVLSEANALEGDYDKYGLTVFPSVSSVPANIFNLFTGTGPVYKNNAAVYVDGTADAGMTGMLYHDAISGKPAAFGVSASDEITLRIEAQIDELSGPVTFNSLELLPFLPGSFDITAMRIFTVTDYRTKSAVPSYSVSNRMPSVSARRIILNEAVDLYALEMDLKLNYQNAAGVFPYGFRHIYFLNARYRENCYMVIRISRENYIDYVSDEIIIHDQTGVRESTCTAEGIELYTGYVNGMLSGRITPSRGLVQYSVPRNTYDVFVRIPVNSAITSIKFREIGER